MKLIPGGWHLSQITEFGKLENEMYCYNKYEYAYICAELITDLLGSEKYRLSLEMMLESLQDHQINK